MENERSSSRKAHKATKQYQNEYVAFKEWDVLLTYLHEKPNVLQVPLIWSKYSMLKAKKWDHWEIFESNDFFFGAKFNRILAE